MNNRLAAIVLILCSALTPSCRRSGGPGPVGPYLGQKPPGVKAEIFAPGIISTGLHDDAGPAFAKDGSEVYFRISGRPHSIIGLIPCVDGIWGKPRIAPFSGQYSDGQFRFSQDGKRLYFESDRPLDNTGPPKDTDVWFVDREEAGWGEPRNLGRPVNSEHDEYLGSVSKDGTVFFTVRKRDPDGRRGQSYTNYSCRFTEGGYLEPAKLEPPFNSDAFQLAPVFSPDETWAILVIRGRSDGVGQEDLYAVFKMEDGSWTEPRNLGPDINSDRTDWFPSFSPDGKYLFFVSWRYTGETYSKNQRTFDEMMNLYASPIYGQGADVYWVDAAAVEALRPGKDR